MVRQFSAGGVVYKLIDGKAKFLIRQNSTSAGYYSGGEWSLPKGWLDDALDGINPGPLTLGIKRATEQEMKTAALREVAEEGGVEAEIVNRLGDVKFFFTDHNHNKVFKIVVFYLMRYLRNLPEGFGPETSSVMWVNCDKAKEMLKKLKGEAGLIAKAEKLIYSGQQSLI